MATITVKLDKRKIKKDGTYTIKLYVVHNKYFWIATPFSSKPEDWNGSEYKKSSPNYMGRNMALRTLVSNAENVIFSLMQSGELINTSDNVLRDMIVGAISTKDTAKKYFVYYFDEYMKRIDNRSTYNIYNNTRTHILLFDSRCTFDSLNKKWLESFETWLHKSIGMGVNSVAIHLRNIRAVFNYCIDEEYTTLYPFRKFSIKYEETRKRALTIEQLRTLKDYPTDDYQAQYRDMFMLMFYLIGINSIDLFNAKKTDLINGRLEYKRAKTSKLYSVKVEPEAMEIINRYKGSEKNGYLLNVLDKYGNYRDYIQHLNKSLKQIGYTERKGRGGKKTISSLFPDISAYWSRHTWATIAAELDIPKETIGHALGHSWAEKTTTDIYIKFDNRKVDKANRRVIDYLLGKE